MKFIPYLLSFFLCFLGGKGRVNEIDEFEAGDVPKEYHIINKEPKHIHTLKEVFQDSFGWLIRCKECDYEEYIYKIDIVKINSKEGGNKDER